MARVDVNKRVLKNCEETERLAEAKNPNLSCICQVATNFSEISFIDKHQ